ncbi:MAG: amidohydrolase family protein, partial [Bacillota bacterium]
LGAGIHIHLAETKDESLNIKKQYGKPPVEFMKYLGLFDLPVLAAHCVHLEPEELDILAEHNVKVAHNPESNMKLASGVAPIPDLLSKNVVVALGTDGPASNNNLELFGEMRMAALLHKVEHSDPMAINAYQALAMATRNGGKALGLAKVGILKKGYKADIILVDNNRPHFYPQHNIIAHLVYSAQPGDVKTVIVNGEVLIEQGKALRMDEGEIYRKVQEASQRIIS